MLDHAVIFCEASSRKVFGNHPCHRAANPYRNESTVREMTNPIFSNVACLIRSFASKHLSSKTNHVEAAFPDSNVTPNISICEEVDNDCSGLPNTWTVL